MARGEMLTVFTYDIAENKRRRKVAKLLEDCASRVQLSVFETRMTEPKANAVAQRIASMLGDHDSLRVYVIGSDGERRSRVFGNSTPFETSEGYWLF